MKIAAALFGLYLFCLAVFPIMVKPDGMAIIVSEEACKEMCCDANPMCQNEKSCERDESCTPCTSCICGICCFCCIVQHPQQPAPILEGSKKDYLTAMFPLVSNYHAECFRPPETV